MRLLAAALLVLSSLAVAVPTAGAQGAGSTILWAHGAAPESGETLWTNFDKADPEATDTANGPGYNCAFSPIPGAGGTLCNEVGDPGLTDPAEGDIDHTFTLPMDPPLAGDLELGSTIGVNLFFGASTGTGSGNAVVRLLAGETVIAESGEIPFAYDQGYEPATGEAAVKVPKVAAGTELTWEIVATGTATGFFLGIHEDNGKSHLVLPVASAAPEVEDLAGATVDIQRTLNESTNATLAFTWPGPAAQQAIQATTEGTGSVRFVVLDAANTTLLDLNATGAQDKRQLVTGAAGNWSITLTLQDFNGTLRLTINDPSITPSGRSPTTPRGTSTRSGSTSAAVGNGTDDDKDTPALALPLAVGALLVVAAVVRRRR